MAQMRGQSSSGLLTKASPCRPARGEAFWRAGQTESSRDACGRGGRSKQPVARGGDVVMGACRPDSREVTPTTAQQKAWPQSVRVTRTRVERRVVDA